MQHTYIAVVRTLALGVFLASALGCASRSSVEPWDAQQTDPGPPHAQTDPGPPQVGAPEPEAHGFGHRMLFWIPNRLCDALDLVRARVRFGPGWTLSARATELVDVNLGAHKTIFVGLRGPRGVPRIPWPFGREDFSGVEVSAADGTQEDSEKGPHYGLLEFGFGMQILIIGPDVGVDVGEALDFVAGIFLFDPVGDDF